MLVRSSTWTIGSANICCKCQKVLIAKKVWWDFFKRTKKYQRTCRISPQMGKTGWKTNTVISKEILVTQSGKRTANVLTSVNRLITLSQANTWVKYQGSLFPSRMKSFCWFFFLFKRSRKNMNMQLILNLIFVQSDKSQMSREFSIPTRAALVMPIPLLFLLI